MPTHDSTAPADDGRPARPRFRVFRFADASPVAGLPRMTMRPLPAAAREPVAAFGAAGAEHGRENRELFSGLGFSLAYVWFKSGYPLARHAHDVDCLYVVLAGSLRVGRDELGAGDGFFVGAGVPYTYTPGPEGVEVLEFRASEAFDIGLVGGAAFWDKAIATVATRRDIWLAEARPSGLG